MDIWTLNFPYISYASQIVIFCSIFMIYSSSEPLIMAYETYSTLSLLIIGANSEALDSGPLQALAHLPTEEYFLFLQG